MPKIGYRKNVSLTRSLMGFLIKIGETPEQNTSPHKSNI